MRCLTPAMRVRVHNGMICLPTPRVVCPKAHARGLVRKAPVLVRTRRGVVLREIRFVTKQGKACSLALGFAPHGSSRKSPAAHCASQAAHP